MNIQRYELHKLNKDQDEYALVIHLDDHLTEFANELGTIPRSKENLRRTALQLIKGKYLGIKVTVVKVMVGGMLVSSLPLLTNTQTASAQTPTTQSAQNSLIYYHVSQGDTLWMISRTFNTTVDNIKRGNNLKSDTLQPNQRLIIPKAIHTVKTGDYLSVLAKDYMTAVSAIREANNLTSDNVRLGQTLIIPVIISGKPSTDTVQPTPQLAPDMQPTAQNSQYTVVSGDSLSVIAKRFSTTVDAIRNTNNLTSDVIRVGQTLTIPSNNETSAPKIQIIDSVYTVVSGDSLSVIAKKFGTTVDALRTANNLNTDVLQIGQRLVIPTVNTNLTTPKQTAPAQDGSTEPVTVSYIEHTIRSGDNIWNLSNQYGVPYNDLLRHNNMTTQSTLRIGQVIQIPQYNVPVRPVVSAKHGEVLDWWTEARYVFSTGKVATITDFQTGKQFQVKHTMGGNHADSEPLMARDAQIMKEIWGGGYSWTPRAIIVEVDGRKLAAAMHSMPHGDQVIHDNNYNGHFCIHFLNSQRHSDGKIQESMQRQIELAAGRAVR
ncbi:LysM peptidoglycan-binding domain-containing protein [Alkalihalobacillus sp. BA299]|uniref:LysM peptidoglycan-binding domain-containing protein n=1 Tax=Alkalihalobacillus sp. BA299 TaxID=2815938 RepID=UPI001ADB9127|nr:LysM peptidoglycan-binding domain-containing protein [Alkalihalobacillus sp. BA299]